MENVKIKLVGGLGNYLFQIAAAFSYSKKYNKSLFLTKEDSVVIHKHVDTYKESILHNIIFSDAKNIKFDSVYTEPGFEYFEIPEIKGSVILDGYFQNDKFFKEHESDIRELFSYPEEYLNKFKEKYKHLLDKNICSIHVRRGDYLKSPNHHPGQNMNYYMSAIKKMSKDSLFIIFSDDISWCKQNFPDLAEKFVFIEGNTDDEDLLLMSYCKNNIIANSTFSWWGAWLNNNSEKKVIAPTNWFGPAYANYNTKDLYCENWIKI